jgi:hypothetical protein
MSYRNQILRYGGGPAVEYSHRIPYLNHILNDRRTAAVEIRRLDVLLTENPGPERLVQRGIEGTRT